MKRLVTAVLFAALAAATPALGKAPAKSSAKAMTTKAATAATAKMEKLTFTNRMVNGKKVWLPAKVQVKPGKIQITLVNTLKDPHGFNVPGLMTPVVVAPNQTKIVTAQASKAGTYKFNCQLHPTHIGGEITVL